MHNIFILFICQYKIERKIFYDDKWKEIELHNIDDPIDLPNMSDFTGQFVLVCSCGTGEDPVRFANEGASFVAGFDISHTAVVNAKKISDFNGVQTHICQMDFHHLAYKDESFDLVYGMEILHHVDCERVADEIYRVLKPGGVAYFRENSDKNPILRFFRRLVFGKPGGYQKQRFLFLKGWGPRTNIPLLTMKYSFSGNVSMAM